MARVLIGIPTYKDDVSARMLFPLLRCTKDHEYIPANVDSSAMGMVCNRLWINALELAEQGHITHFLMQHSDIAPMENYYVDKMIAIMERTGADILSAVVPIKDGYGTTSTALDEPCGDVPQYWRVRRLTMKEIYDMEPTFTHEKLLLNTGLMLVDMRKAWTKDAYFTFEDKIIWWHGRRVAVAMPEDWSFSRMARKLGATKLYATREVPLNHIGNSAYPNTHVWGSLETDQLPSFTKEASEAADAANKIRGYMSWEELAWLAENAKGKDVVEVGSWLGRSTKAIASSAKVVYAVDHWKGTLNDPTLEEAKTIDPWAEFNHNLGPEINSRKVIPIARGHEEVGPTMTYYDGLTLDTCPVGPVDMVFIDGDHEYEAVKRDILNAKAMLKPGGLLCGHDFSDAHPGVMKAVRELVPGFSVGAGASIWKAPPLESPAWELVT
jgi:SAM-dependent methyltransferase